MQIHELNSRTPTATDEMALDTGSLTYKTTAGQLRPQFTSSDMANPTSWDDVPVLTGNNASITYVFERLTRMFRNIRYLWKLIGSNDFSNVASTISGAIGNTALTTTATTISGAIAEHETDIAENTGRAVQSFTSQYSSSIRLFRYGYLRILVIESVAGLTSGAQTTLCNIPASDRPSAQVTADSFSPSSGNVSMSIRTYVATNGDVKIYNYSSSTGTINTRILIPYLVNTQ